MRANLDFSQEARNQGGKNANIEKYAHLFSAPALGARCKKKDYNKSQPKYTNAIFSVVHFRRFPHPPILCKKKLGPPHLINCSQQRSPLRVRWGDHWCVR